MIPTTAIAATAETKSAKPTASEVLVDGKTVQFDAYIISDYNYFKLRDVAITLSGTESQFDVGWNQKEQAISITTGKPYTVEGGEMAKGGTEKKTAKPTTSKVFVDGKPVALTAYNISDYNYFKLRDLAAAIGFFVDWDEANNTIIIQTKTPTVPDTPPANVDLPPLPPYADGYISPIRTVTLGGKKIGVAEEFTITPKDIIPFIRFGEGFDVWVNGSWFTAQIEDFTKENGELNIYTP
ncbi:MAG: copper amine oxidase N-terminal domain-containing protein [Oscillospiraceae bacterium]|jgi:hypothetical protein|nr:copper amine oxidase N-terminal domain-containing protein [Oscillospiraceae bacterium]